MKLSIDFGRWTNAKAALAVAGALAIGGAVGSAIAMSPTIEPPIKWGGGVEFIHTSGTGIFKVYTVPAGRNFILTDLVASNFTGYANYFTVYAGLGDSCSGTLVARFNSIIVPPENNIVLAFQTGIGFGAGQAVCLQSTAALSYSGRGFLFTTAPAS